MSVEKTMDSSFTDVFYAVVAGSAFQRFDPYVWGWEDTILLASLAILLDDWVLYHMQIPRISLSRYNFAIILFFDVSVLLLWYAMARAGAAPND